MILFAKILQVIAIGLSVGVLFGLVTGNPWTATKIGLGATGVTVAYFLIERF